MMYVAYRGDRCIGVFLTKYAVAEFFGVSVNSVCYAMTNCARKRPGKDALIVERIEDE